MILTFHMSPLKPTGKWVGVVPDEVIMYLSKKMTISIRHSYASICHWYRASSSKNFKFFFTRTQMLGQLTFQRDNELSIHLDKIKGNNYAFFLF